MNDHRPIVIVDLDGTLCDCDHRRNYVIAKDWKSFYGALSEDPVKTNVANFVTVLSHFCKIVIVSGRPDNYLEPTLKWLEKMNISYNEIYMRREGDYRKDSIVKREIYEKHINNGYNKVMLVLDDRNQVVEMWRSLGLECWQVADGNF